MPTREVKMNEISVDQIARDHTAATIRALAEQPKRRVRIPKPLVSKPEITTHHEVGINGHWILIPYDKTVEVPDEVYRILLRAGLTFAQDDEDAREEPGAPTLPNGRPLPQNFDVR